LAFDRKSAPLIEASGLRKDYSSDAGHVPALRAVSLRVNRGEFVAIMGPSGSGKSTLMNIFGLLDTPSAGTLRFTGRDVSDLDVNARAHIRNTQIGFIFQSYNLLPRLNALENVELPLLYAGQRRNERLHRAREMLKAVGLGDRQKHWPNQLSGGEQQRVSIARAMVTRPALVLADEPTGALDSRTGAIIMQLLGDLVKRGATVVIVTHDEIVAQHAGRIVRMADGALAKQPPLKLEPRFRSRRHERERK
jgi:putative ABC transport system ATP-binding protein